MTSFLTWDLLVSFDIVIKSIMGIIVSLSIFSWTIFLHKFFLLRSIQACNRKFLDNIQGGNLLMQSNKKIKSTNILAVMQFHLVDYFNNYSTTQLFLKSLEFHAREKAMQIVHEIEQNIAHLATISSITPFIGLFGTVWGIMNSFHVIADVQSLHVVLPTIAEALFVTALGLVTAIPAIIFYNTLVRHMRKIKDDLDNFVEKMLLEIEGRIM